MVVVCILIVLLYYTIIASSVRNMIACGEGTEELLRNIPEDVVRKVPAVASYLSLTSADDAEVRTAMMKSEKLLRNILPPSITARLKVCVALACCILLWSTMEAQKCCRGAWSVCRTLCSKSMLASG